MKVSLAALTALTLALVPGIALAQQPPEPAPTAAAIMSRVAANQDRAESERHNYVYVQHAQVTSRKGRKVMCEEMTDARVTPSESGSRVDLLSLHGRLLHGHAYVDYSTPLPPHRHDATMAQKDDDGVTIDIGDDDREMVESLRDSLTNDHSRDGLNSRLFPLTTQAQRDYLFHLAGQERMNGREVYHVQFQPRDKNEYGWKGDAWIDRSAYQPVVVSTTISRNMPFAVRTALGTSVPGLGFSVNYAPQADGVWFPVSFGTEFKIHVLFLFSREIIIAAQNRDFEKTNVTSRIVAEGAHP